MSKLYSKAWSEGRVGYQSTRAGNQELTVQALYGSKSDPKIGAEITIKVLEDGTFRMFVNIPSMSIDEAVDLE